MRYLDPKNYLTFKKVFGQHPHLLKSFLNALLPLDQGQFIESLEYMPSELVPEIPLFKHTIVDVRCKDNNGRQFIAEMQMFWTDSFKQRVLFNASKAYIRQLDKGEQYHILQPVYALSLVNDVFEPDMELFYHHYKIVHLKQSDKQIDGLQFVFVELPKFKPHNISEKRLHISEKRLQVLWLRYLTEITDGTNEIAKELLLTPEIKEAVECIQESAFSRAELDFYDKYWDSIQTERTLYAAAERRGEIRGEKKGERAKTIAFARIMKQNHEPIDKIMKFTGLSKEEIEKL